MQLYSVSDEYISYLRKIFSKAYSNKEDTRSLMLISKHRLPHPHSPSSPHDFNMIYYFRKEASEYEYTSTGLRIINCIIAILFLYE